MKYRPTILLTWLPLVTLCATAAGEDPLSFNQDIRPILSDHCFACHGPDANHREADLRLDDRDSAIGYGAVVPGEPDESLLVERILSDDPDLVMPPPRGGKKLRAADKQRLVQWIRQGAPYQNHWAFEAVPKTVAVPAAGSGWARNDIDRFIAQAHQRKGFTPSPEVTRSTWLRRVTFDLTGLPPTLEARDAFLADQTAGAYERVVDRLLASQAYGERMASMWLDVSRYADTFGYQNDVAMEVWPWRDWVIAAFNRNLPYDQFLTEQIAGDLLPGATQDQRLATTFNRLHRQTNEGGSVAEEFRLTGIADRTTTAGTAFLGLTLECCRCHDHKFDPIQQRDFYQMSAYFADIDELGLYSHFTFSQPTPAMMLYEGDQRQRHEEALRAVARAERALRQAIAKARSRWLGRMDEVVDELPEVRPALLHMPLDGDQDGVVDTATPFNGDDELAIEKAPEFGRTSPFTFSLWARPAAVQPRMILLHQSVAAEDSGFRGLELTIDHGHPQFSMIHFWPGNAVRIRSRQTIPVDEWSHVAVTHDGSATASGLRLFVNGNAVDVDVIRDGLTRDIRHRKEWGDMKVGQVKLALGARFRDIGFRDGIIDELKVFDVELSRAEIAALYHLVQIDAPQPAGSPQRDNQDAESVHEGFKELRLEHEVMTDDDVIEARKRLQDAREEEDEIATGIRQIMVMEHSDQAAPVHVLERGDYTKKGDLVSADVPRFLGDIPTDGQGRLELARWMTHPNNPLTSRVIVNRMWHLFFGRGIVVTLEDFGSQGTPPSHPRLLDFLARSLMDSHWNLKALCRQIVLSATYRQASAVGDATVLESDPHNTWLSRGPKYRLSAEQLRDAVLSASELLVPKIGGSSVMPYQPTGLWRESGTGKSYQQSQGDGLYRRSLYTFWKRTAPPPSMLTFDATSRESCTSRRELTTTPLQALVFLNDPQFVEAARVLAERLVAEHNESLDARWDELFLRLISRQPTAKEQTLVMRTYDEQRQYFSADPENATRLLGVGEREPQRSLDPVDVAATTVVVQTIMAYDETIMLR